jgi:uncharacterized membrane protein YccC
VRELSPKVVELVRALARRADSFATVLLDHNADRERVTAERTELTKSYLDVQTMQHSTYFESAEARVLDQPLRSLTQAAMELCAVAEAATAHRGSESFTADGPIASALVHAADERNVELARTRLWECIGAFDRGEELPHPTIAGGLWSDPVSAALTGIRSALAVGIASAFWFATAWPTGPTAIVVVAVLCSLLASLEQPDKITMVAAATVLIAAVPVFATQFYLMPLAVDFPSLAVALAPLMLTCGFIMAQPRIGTLGLLVAAYFAFASNIDNVMRYDAAAFLNSSLAVLVGIAAALVLFATFFPETPAYADRRFRRQVLVHLSHLTGACPCGPALRGYQRALFEQLGATLARVKEEPKLAHECLTSALTTLSAAQAICRLKGSPDVAVVAPPIDAERSRLLARLSQTLRNPSVWKFGRRAAEARALARHALATAQGSAKQEEIEALNGIIVGSATLGSDLLRARMILQGKSNAIPI